MSLVRLKDTFVLHSIIVMVVLFLLAIWYKKKHTYSLLTIDIDRKINTIWGFRPNMGSQIKVHHS